MFSFRMQSKTIFPAVAAIVLFAAMAEAQSLDWIEPSLASLPAARGDAGMAYDAATHSTVLFGGGNGNILKPTIVYGDTWIWRNGWFQRSPAASPAARGGPGMAYDPTTGTVVLFGGYNIDLTYLNDTWTWDGVTWTEQFPPVSPPARSFNSQEMAYHTSTGTVVLFGGYGNGTVFGDTWEWDGRAKTWTQQFPRPARPRAGVRSHMTVPPGRSSYLAGIMAAAIVVEFTMAIPGLGTGSTGLSSFRRQRRRRVQTFRWPMTRTSAKSSYSAGSLFPARV